ETDEELEAQRAAARADKRAPVVRGRRDRTPEEMAELDAAGRRPAWRFAVDVEGRTVIDDYVRGAVTFEHAAIEDFVVVRSDGTTTIFTRDELVAGFSIGRVSKSPAIFDLKKLSVLNGRHMRLMPNDEFEDELVGYLAKTGFLASRGAGAEALVRASAPLVK